MTKMYKHQTIFCLLIYTKLQHCVSYLINQREWICSQCKNYQMGTFKAHSLCNQCLHDLLLKGILLTKPFQASLSWHQLSFYENKICVQNCLLDEWILVAVQIYLLHHSPFKPEKKLCTVHIGRPLIKRSAHIPRDHP